MKHEYLKKKLICLSLLVIVFMVYVPETVAENAHKDMLVGHFSTLPAGVDQPPGWEPLIFRKIHQHTRYELVSEDGVGVIRAVSD